MRCVLWGGALEYKLVDEEVPEGNNHYLIEMKVEVCQDCGERYYQEGQVDELIKWKKELKGNKSQYREIGKVYQVA